MKNPSWKFWVFSIPVLYLAIHFDVSSLLFTQDRDLWNHAGWKSYEDEKPRRIELLLKLGADPEYVHRRKGISVLENAVEWRNLDVIKIIMPLVSEETRSKAMAYACRRGYAEPVALFFDAGVEPGEPVYEDEAGRKVPNACFLKIKTSIDDWRVDTDTILSKREIITPGRLSKSKDYLPVVRVARKTREHCEGWVEIRFAGAHDIASGSYEILDSKPPGKHDTDAIEALIDSYSLEKFSPGNSRMGTLHLEDGRTEHIFTYFVDCDNKPKKKDEAEQ